MANARMMGHFKAYTPNNRAATPGRKKSVMVKQNGKNPDTRDLVKRYIETKEK